MNQKLKILYVDMGGVNIYSCDKPAGRILGWVSEGNEVSLLIPGLMSKTAKREIQDNSKYPERIKIINFPFSERITTSSYGIIFSYFLRLLFSPSVLFMNKSNYDFGYSNSPVLVDIVPILWLKLFGRCKHWVLMLDSIVPLPSQRSGSGFINIITYLESRFVNVLANFFASAVFTVNPELKKEMIKRGIKKEKIILSQNGLFMERINSVKNQKSKKYDAVYMGRISINKGVLDLIKIWKKLVKKRPKAKLAIMGMGLDDIVMKFKREIEKNDMVKNIEYLGFTPSNKKYTVLKKSKVFLYLSKVNADESWGISLMEALACGLPAISYNLPIYEHIYKTESLIRIKLNDLDSVTKKLIYLLENQKVWLSLSKKSINFAKNFDWFKIAKEDLKKIKKVLF